MLQILLNTSLVKFASLFGALVFSWLISLLLPVSEAGRLFAVLSITPGIAVFINFGVDQTVLRLGAKRFLDNGPPGLFEVMGYSARSILRRTALIIMLTSPIALGIWYLWPQKVDVMLQWGLALLIAPFFAALIPSAMGFRVQSRYRRSILSEPSAVMTFAAIGFAMLSLLFEPQFWLAFGAYAAALVVLSFPLFRAVSTPQGDPVDHDRYFGVTQIAQYFLQWGVVGQISFYAPSAEIAAISLSMRMVMLVNFILVIVSTVNGNKISQYLQTGQFSELRMLLQKQSPILLGVGTSAAITLGIFAPYVYGSLGEGFENATRITRILIAGQLVNVLTGQANVMLNMSGNARTTSSITIAGGIMTTALVWPSYQLGGILGVAVLISLSLSCVNFLMALFAARATGIRPLWPRGE
jgi:O-antigen/teichoic acid export membrane protein